MLKQHNFYVSVRSVQQELKSFVDEKGKSRKSAHIPLHGNK
jgi:hypothetical protein